MARLYKALLLKMRDRALVCEVFYTANLRCLGKLY